MLDNIVTKCDLRFSFDLFIFSKESLPVLTGEKVNWISLKHDRFQILSFSCHAKFRLNPKRLPETMWLLAEFVFRCKPEALSVLLVIVRKCIRHFTALNNHKVYYKNRQKIKTQNKKAYMALKKNHIAKNKLKPNPYKLVSRCF